jgi:diacylglycerol kinase family enzyme
MLANFGAVFNELLTLGPGIRQDDGMLDLCVFSPRTLRDSVRVVRRLMRKDFRSDPCMLYAPGRRIRVETTPPRPVQADGDMLGMTPFEAIVEPLAAHLLVPRRG